jgi:hypothetical protein
MEVCPCLPDSGIMFVSHALDPQSLLDNAARYRNHSLAGLRRSFSRIPPSGLPAPLGPDAAGTAFPGVDRIPHWRLGSARNHLRQVGTGTAESNVWIGRTICMAYGVGAALTLDEFALWLNLQDVYWERQGRESFEAMALFAGALCVGIFGHPFFHGVALEFAALIRRKSP